MSGVDKVFDYLLPDDVPPASVPVGTIVRVPLGPRNVRAWVVEHPRGDVHGSGDALRPIDRIVSAGPAPELVDLATWAAHRWAGRRAAVLKSASPDRIVTGVRPSRPGPGRGHRVVVHRTPPGVDRVGLVASLAADGPTLVIVPGVADAGHLIGRLRRVGLAGRSAEEWDAARSARVVVGARSAVWATVDDLAAVVVVDEHDESLQEERSPTWHAREVAVERARRADVPVHLLSPIPTLAALEAADEVVAPDRSLERRGWPLVDVVDRRHDDPPTFGLFSPRLARVLADTDGPILAVLNRTGRARLLACASCGELVRTEDGEHLMVEDDEGLVAPRTGERRPRVCARCAGTSLKRLKLGVDRAAEELAALLGEPVSTLTAGQEDSDHRVALGTEAVLHRRRRADVVAFLDLDQELLAPRHGAAEQALGLVARAARVVGGRRPGARIVVQTRLAEHRVLDAVVRADPAAFAAAEREIRRSAGWPPFRSLAQVTGAGADEVVATVTGPVEVLGPDERGRFLLRADDPGTLADALAAPDVREARRRHRARVVVDPPRA